ncbi:MAG: D-alanyl-D-alanine carboxypeptidase [Pseudomonadota bacterium]|nr:D-alanyl-D-alanine carboxypeptidase [Pseudomonadota bacterium]
MLTFCATFCRTGKAAAGAGLGLALVVASFIAPPAEARHWRPHRHAWLQTHFEGRRHHKEFIRYRHAPGGGGTSNIAAIVVDGNSGRTLYARNENELRFPASITKVMTLYLLFEQLEQGRLRLDSDIRVSAYAAAQKPTKLGLHPGETIRVDDAIKAVVTRSANDIAVAIAETIGGDEENFAGLMTLKAHALGMNSTHFANASGLPNGEQVTTARDLAILGRTVQERFPRHYHYFATHAFYYDGATIVNHNHLLDRVEGMDGIKTGYTRASGFNLLTSVKRNGHYIVAVVLGGPSARARDKIMADLIEDQIENGATVRTASSISDTGVNGHNAEAAKSPDPSLRGTESPEKIDSRLALVPSPPRPNLAGDPIQIASLYADVPPEKSRPAFVSGAPKLGTAAPRAALGENNSKQASLDGSTARGRPGLGGDLSTATPSAMRANAGPAAARAHGADKIAAAIKEPPQGGVVTGADGRRPAAARSGWMIQIGATADISKATELLARAKSEGRKTLTTAQAFTEKVQKGSETLYRARFAGLEADSAELACKTLKRSGFSCFATKN